MPAPLDKSRRAKAGDPRRIEYRAIDGRAAGDDPGFSGYASTAWHVDAYGTAFAPGAWKKSLQERGDKVLVLWQHDPYLPIGKPTRLEEDATGLAVDAAITEATTYGKEAMALLRDDVPLGLSVGFRTIRERPATDADPLILGADLPEWIKQNLPGSVYVIEEAKLYEFSVVSFPANLHAEIDAVRQDERAQALAGLLADLRAGRLDESSRALAAELVAAYQAAGPGVRQSAPPTADEARHDRAAALSVWAATVGLSLEQLRCLNAA